MDFYENMRELGIGTVIAIGVGSYTQKLALADKWTSRVSLQNGKEETKVENVSSGIMINKKNF